MKCKSNLKKWIRDKYLEEVKDRKLPATIFMII
jgi:hypothetical protein